ncbi:DUF4282 domain-containing protein [Bradyrhizobium sp. CB82]|uniref:DUF4282 domain-containing protein n=1 Tax=Bradyrhizobium sp. CB82 TaxID=3039159 RepID=UPI0032C21B0B
MMVGLAALAGLAGIVSGLAIMAVNPFAGFLSILLSIFGPVVAITVTRVGCEFVLIVFRINEHLGSIRDRNGD